MKQIAVLVTRGRDQNLNIARMIENWKLVLGNVGSAADMRPIVPLRA
jgi:hypothetical protein